MVKWEYKITSYGLNEMAKDISSIDFINELGKQGWELVSVSEGGLMGAPSFYLKRPYEPQTKSKARKTNTNTARSKA